MRIMKMSQNQNVKATDQKILKNCENYFNLSILFYETFWKGGEEWLRQRTHDREVLGSIPAGYWIYWMEFLIKKKTFWKSSCYKDILISG